MLIYAKNLAGDILPLPLPSPTSWDMGRNRYEETENVIRRVLAEHVCPDEPSRLVLLDHTPGAVSAPPLSTEEITDLLEELHALSLQQVSDEGEQKEEGEWADGDIVTYMVKDSERCVQLLEKRYALYSLEDDAQECPYVQIEVLVRQGNAPYKPGYMIPDVLYAYPFLFGVREGAFYPPTAWSIQEEDGYPYLCFTDSPGFKSLDELLAAEPDGSGDMSRIRRAIGRKWIRFLRRKGQATAEERRLEALYPTELFPGEKQAWKALYWAAKAARKG